MARATDPDVCDWLRDEAAPVYTLQDRNQDGRYTVGRVMPAGFEAYCKIMHPLYGETEPGFTYLETEDWSQRVSWREMARVFGVDFDSKLSWDSFWRADKVRLEQVCLATSEGSPGLRFCEQLAEILTPDAEPPVFFWFSGTLRAVVDESIPEVLRAELGELVEVVREMAHGYSPEYMWPHRRRWCVHTDYDSDFTLVAGSSSLVERILANDLLEAMSVRTSDSLSSRPD